MIPRPDALARIERALHVHPAAALIGPPRQCGKTTINRLENLQGHPKLGASWEGFALEHVIGKLKSRDIYFWATYAGAELDLMVIVAGRRHGFEFKYADAPGRTRSMHIALKDLSLEHLWVIYPGRQKYALHENITVIPIDAVPHL